MCIWGVAGRFNLDDMVSRWLACFRWGRGRWCVVEFLCRLCFSVMDVGVAFGCWFLTI